MEKKKLKKIKLENLIVPVLGIIMGILLYKYGYELGKNYYEKIDFETSLFLDLISIFISFYLVVIIHELGHLVFGLATGYKFLSFRVGKLTLVKYDTAFKIKKFQIAGTGGQCLMEPPEFKENNFPYVLYNLGGGLLNIITSIISLIAYYFVVSEGLKSFLFIFTMFGLVMALTNLIPLKLGGINNDGMNIWYLIKNKDARFSFYLILKAESLCINGTRTKDMSKEWFDINENLDFSNSINVSRKILKGNYYLDKKEFSLAKEIYKEIFETKGLIKIFKLELACEIIFCELMTEANKEVIEKFYTREIKNYILKSGIILSKLRTRYAYEALVSKDINKANKIKAKFNKTLKTYPSKGEILAEQEFMKMIDEKIIL